MDKKSLIILLVSFVVLMAWYPLTSKLYPPRTLPPRTNLVSSATSTNAATNGAVSGPLAISNQPPSAVAASASPAVPGLPPGAPEETLIIENALARYTFTSHGGGIKLVELKNFPGSVGCRDNAGASTNRFATLNAGAPVPAFAIREEQALGTPAPYRLSRSANGVRAETEVSPGLTLIKDFQLSTNYLLEIEVRYENRSTQAVRLPEREIVLGTATPMGLGNEDLNLGIEWFDGEDAEQARAAWFANSGFLGFGGQPRPLYQMGSSNVVWGAAFNQFFAMVGVPEAPAYRMIGHQVALPPPTRAQLAADPSAMAAPHGFQAGFVLPPVALAAGHFTVQKYQFFAGPKEYRTLSRLPKDMDHVMGFSGFSGFFAKPLLLSMNGIHALGASYGMAIIIVTIIIKLLFWPLTNASTKSMKRMAALQPEMKALQEKYKDDPKKMNVKLMEFMKEHKVSPLGGCLPLLLQIPVFLGFYTMLQSAIELRGASFLWACDLSQADTVFRLGSFPLNPLPVLMAGTMLWQARLTPLAPGMDPFQQQMMRYMPLIFVVFIYNMASGLTLYWTVQNLLSIAQMKITRAAEEKSGPAGPPAKGAPRPALPPKRKK